MQAEGQTVTRRIDAINNLKKLNGQMDSELLFIKMKLEKCKFIKSWTFLPVKKKMMLL